MSINYRRLKAERIAKGLSQEEMAKLMGWDSRTPWAKRENGFVNIGADELAKAAQILDIPMNNLSIFFTSDVPEKEQNKKD